MNYRSVIEDQGLTDAVCSQKVSDDHLQQISRSHCSQWKSLPPYLGLETIVAEDIDKTQKNPREKRHDFLKEWRGTSDGTYKQLITALLKINCREDAEKVCQILKQSLPSQPQPRTVKPLPPESVAPDAKAEAVLDVALAGSRIHADDAEISTLLDLKTVCTELGSVKVKSHEIGVLLGIPQNKLLEFQKCDLPAIANFWLSGNVEGAEISWKTVAAALESDLVGEPGLAKKIREKYCQPVNKRKERASAVRHSSPLCTPAESKATMSNTQKHQTFLKEQMGDKPVTAVPGIGDGIGAKLKANGINTAKQLYGEYIKNPARFQECVKSHGANFEWQALAAYEAMRDWDERHFSK